MLKAEFQKNYKEFFLDISFEISSLSYNIFLGPSGAGKSLCLKILAGFEHPDKGRILLYNKNISHLPPEKRQIVYLPQNLGIFPHLNVKKHLLYSFKCQKRSVNKIFLERVIEEFGLKSFLDRMPYELSGGERQRLALARALMAQPKVLLLDEPLSGLDFHLKMKLINFLKDIKEKFGLTVIHVTHDPIEAITLAEEVVIVEKGKIQFSGTLRELFHTDVPGFTSEIARQLSYLRKGLNNCLG